MDVKQKTILCNFNLHLSTLVYSFKLSIHILSRISLDNHPARFQPTFGIQAPESALLFVILSPVSAYYKTSTDGAVSIYADPNVVRAFPGGVGNRKVGSNYGPTIGKLAKNISPLLMF